MAEVDARFTIEPIDVVEGVDLTVSEKPDEQVHEDLEFALSFRTRIRAGKLGVYYLAQDLSSALPPRG